MHLGLTLAILLTAQVVGMARGQAQVAGEMVICSGGAVVTVQTDANGNPIGPVHICPDCAMTLLAAHAAPVWEITLPVSLRFIAWDPSESASVAPRPVIVAVARGPPSVV